MAILLKKVTFKAKKERKIKYLYIWKIRVKSLPNRPSFVFLEIKSKVAYISKKQNNTFQGKNWDEKFVWNSLGEKNSVGHDFFGFKKFTRSYTRWKMYVQIS